MEQATSNEEEWARADFDFHNSILLASHNELMISLLNILRNALLQSRHSSFRAVMERDAQQLADVLRKHKAVMDAIVLRDGELAFQKMEELLQLVGGVIRNR